MGLSKREAAKKRGRERAATSRPARQRDAVKKRAHKGLQEAQENKDRAKQIILQILKQSDDGSLGKTKLFKAFWLAHVLYPKKNPGYLSAWPIVRLPHGPGIDHGDILIRELKESEDVRLSHKASGVHTEIVCMLVKDPATNLLPKGAVDAIASAYRIVESQTVDQLSEWSHAYSRSWNETPNGEELDIYTDHIPDDVYQERKQTLEEINEALDDLFR
jgi:hypothetical protein